MAIQQGANPEQLRALGKQLTIKSTTIRNAQRSIDQLTARLPQVWAGQDAEDFARAWAQLHRPAFQKIATDLADSAKTLAANADAQERTSAELDGGRHGGAAGPGGSGPGGSGTAPGGKDTPWLPDWLENNPFYNAWNVYGTVKAFPNLRFGVTELVRLGRGLDLTADSDKLLVGFRNAFKVSSDIFDLNFKDISVMGGLAETSKWAKGLDAFGKGLGGLGVAIDGVQAIDHFSDGDYGQGAYSLVKAGLGAASFLPPPAGTACMVASGALALYDNVPVIHNAVNAVGSGVKDAAEGVAHAAESAWDGAKSFFGF